MPGSKPAWRNRGQRSRQGNPFFQRKYGTCRISMITPGRYDRASVLQHSLTRVWMFKSANSIYTLYFFLGSMVGVERHIKEKGDSDPAERVAEPAWYNS